MSEPHRVSQQIWVPVLPDCPTCGQPFLSVAHIAHGQSIYYCFACRAMQDAPVQPEENDHER